MKERTAHTAEQIAGAERITKILMSIPKEARDMAAIAVAAYADGFQAGQAFKDSEEGRQVLANQ